MEQPSEHDPQLLEDSHEVSGIHLASEGEVAKDFFIDLGSSGQFLVLGCQLKDLCDFVFDLGKAEKGHFEGARQMNRGQLQLYWKLVGH